VTDATISEIVKVLVMVAVEVRVRPELLSAMASRGSKRPIATIEKRILEAVDMIRVCVYDSSDLGIDLRCASSKLDFDMLEFG
jgi:hypothetical protein